MYKVHWEVQGSSGALESSYSLMLSKSAGASFVDTFVQRPNTCPAALFRGRRTRDLKILQMLSYFGVWDTGAEKQIGWTAIGVAGQTSI